MDDFRVPARERKLKSALAHALTTLQREGAARFRSPVPRNALVAASPTAEVAQLRDAWAEFLGRWPWDLFCTFTVRDQIAPEALDKRYRLLVSEASRQLYGRRWSKRGVGIRWVRAWELQRRGVYHLHALWGETRAVRTSTCKVRWEQLCCRPGEKYDPERPAGIARFERILSGEAVRRYVSKYVAKGGELDLGGGPFRFLLDRPSTWPARINNHGLSRTPLGKSVLTTLRAAFTDDEWDALLKACEQRQSNHPLLGQAHTILRGERETAGYMMPGDDTAQAPLLRATRSPSSSGQVCGPEPDGGPTAG